MHPYTAFVTVMKDCDEIYIIGFQYASDFPKSLKLITFTYPSSKKNIFYCDIHATQQSTAVRILIFLFKYFENVVEL